ncbi:toll-like receptor 1 [Rhinophrynus dorsalis]
MSSLTTVLDLSFNLIDNLEKLDFFYMPALKVLNVSNNQIQYLDSNAFELNINLEYLDLTYNKLINITGIFPKHLRYLDISFNNFKTLFMCKGFGNMLQLEYLGLDTTQILKSDLEALSHLHLRYVFIVLKRLSEYENGSLLMLNTMKLHLLLPSNNKDPYNVLFDAVNTSKFLELSDIYSWKLPADPHKYISDIAKNSKVTHLTMRNIKLQWEILVYSFQQMWFSSLERLNLYDVTLQGPIKETKFDYTNTSMKAVSVQRVETEVFEFDQGVLYRVFSEMNIENLTINSASMLFMVCPLHFSTLQNIDFSKNALTDDLFQDCSTLNKLKILELRQNKLGKLSKVSSMTQNMPSLEYLDVSHNLLQYNEEACHWSQSIVKLNLASNTLTTSVFNCLPMNIKTLILKNNEITHLPKELIHIVGLEELNLAYNRLADLPDCTNLSRLILLSVDNNQILYPSPESVKSCQSVEHINAGDNPFQCNCEIKSFIREEENSPGKMIGWPDAYICKYPDNVKGTKLKDFYLPEIYCNIFILIPVIILPTIFVLALMFGLCKYFDIPWFLKMIWQWTRTKHRIIRKRKDYQVLQKDLVFHAFVSYSEHDSSWVKNIFLPNIEKGDDCIRICQHERNFVPGKSIIENIIHCIDKSYKSIFILSPHFVQSEWCHYELYFAHHKLYTESTDNLILVLLEPIPQYIIPSKYFKLKALMAQRTYLEWPKEKSKHGLFWANLRAAIHINLSLSDPESHSTCSVSSITS